MSDKDRDSNDNLVQWLVALFMLFIMVPLIIFVGLIYIASVVIEGINTEKCPECGWRNNKNRQRCQMCLVDLR